MRTGYYVVSSKMATNIAHEHERDSLQESSSGTDSEEVNIMQ